MKRLIPWIILLILTGCCRVAELPPWPAENRPDTTSSLYRFRLERSSETKFSGLLALQPRAGGIWSGLLDATGVPLVKMVVYPDGTRHLEYCATALHGSRMPELLGKLVEYIYFTPAAADCPWYAFSCVCLAAETPEQMVKWKRMGLLRLWEIEKMSPPDAGEKITVHLNLSSVTVHLDHMDNKTGK